MASLTAGTCDQPCSASWFWWTPQLPTSEMTCSGQTEGRISFYKHLGAGVWTISVRVFLGAPKTTSFPLLKVTMMWAYPIFETLKPKLPSLVDWLWCLKKKHTLTANAMDVFFSLKKMIFVVVVQTVSLNMLLHRCYAGYIPSGELT